MAHYVLSNQLPDRPDACLYSNRILQTHLQPVCWSTRQDLLILEACPNG